MKHWRHSVGHPCLQQGEIHLWRVSLDSALLDRRHFADILSSDERLRAQRFVFEKHRQAYISARGVLRSLVGAYVGLEPRRVRFYYEPCGKPYINHLLGEHQLHFNLAHSHQLALYAFALDRRIGIDVEYLDGQLNYQELARTVFSPCEWAALQQVPEPQRCEAFFDGWTRKEAYVKACGQGLLYPLQQLEVSLHPDRPAALLTTRPDPAECSQWLMLAIEPGPGYTGAVVVEGQAWTVRAWDYA